MQENPTIKRQIICECVYRDSMGLHAFFRYGSVLDKRFKYNLVRIHTKKWGSPAIVELRYCTGMLRDRNELKTLVKIAIQNVDAIRPENWR